MTFYLAKLPIARRLFLTFSLAAVIPDLIIVMMISIYTHALIVNGVGPVQTGPLLLAAVIALLCSTGAVIALGFLMYLTITRPLLHLVDLTQRIEKDDTTARAHLTGHDEIGIVATSMNSMLDHIVRLIQETQGQRDRLQGQVEQLVNEVSGVGEGDLRIQAEVTHAELGVLADSFNYMVEELSSLVIRVKQVAREVEVSTMQTSDRMAQLMESASVQIAQMTEAALEVERMAHASQQVSQRAQQLAHMAETARETARVGGASMRQTIQGMGRVTQNVQTTAQKVHVLESRSEEISAISEVMSALAHSTNRLSLDAAIQAAMAGESGKGFAAVAADIRRLAEKAKEEASKITRIVGSVREEIAAADLAMRETTRETETGMQLAHQADAALGSIFSVVERQAQEIATINQVALAQVRSSSAVVRVMQNISHSTQSSSVKTQEAAQQLGQQARVVSRLHASVEVFKLPEQRDGSSRTPVIVPTKCATSC